MRIAATGVALIFAGIAIWLTRADSAEALVYWVNNPNTIGRADLDGSRADPDFITGVVAGQFMVRKGQNLYWANSSSSAIGKGKIDGTGVNQAFISTGLYPTHVGLGGGFMYWDNFGPPATMGRANVNGNTATNVNNGYLSGFANAPAVTADDDAFYFSTWPGNTIFRREHDTNSSTTVFTPSEQTYSLAVDAKFVYWADFSAGAIGRVRKDGSGANPSFITGIDGPAQMVTEGKFIYWTSNFGKRIGRALRKDGSKVRHTFIDLAAYGSPYGIAVDSIPSTGNKFRILKKKVVPSTGQVRLTIAFPGPGKLKISGKKIKAISKKVGTRKFKLTFTVKPRVNPGPVGVRTTVAIRFKPDLSSGARKKKTKLYFVQR